MEYGCIGEHLPHSFSKEIHELIETYDYQLKEIAPEDLDAFMKAADFQAINVTIPYKQSVIPYLSQISEQAETIGAVNTIVNRDGKLYGYNTDFFGMNALFNKLELDPAGKKVLILGTGGTSRTAKALMEDRGAGEIYRVSRTGKEDALSYEEIYEKHTDAEIVINTTPAGMFPKTNDSPLDLARFPKLEGVVDVVYNPLRTLLIQQAESLGVKAEGGLYMLVAQAVYAAQFFTGKEYRPEIIDRIFKKIRSDKENIVITGMSGAGKSAVGTTLHRITGRKLYDTDVLIAEKAGLPIPEIFRIYGEDHFRDLEAEVIRDIATENGALISTGGGAVLRQQNIQELKKNGRVFFLRRDISEIPPSKDRPLADTEEKVAALYQKRLPIYEATADSDVYVTGTPEDTAQILLKTRIDN